MDYLKRPLGAFFLLVMIIMGSQVALKKPLCIDSNIVYKINRTKAGRTETVYSCDQFKKVSFSGFFYEKLDLLKKELQRAEAAAALFPKGFPRVNIVIETEALRPAPAQPGTVRIHGEDLGTGRLASQVVHASLARGIPRADPVFLTAVSDLFTGFEPGSGGEHPLIAEAWNSTFAGRGFFEKRALMRALAARLNNGAYDPRVDAIENLRRLLGGLGNSGGDLQARFAGNLENRGYFSRESLSGQRFDVIVEVPRAAGKKMAADLLALSRSFPDLKIAFKTDGGTYLLPSVLQVPPEMEPDLRAEYRLIFSAGGGITPELIRSYMENSQRLVFVDLKAGREEISLKPLFTGGMKAFLSANRQLDFVQLHLPSYRLKSSALSGVRDYFAFVRTRGGSFRKEQRALGWEQTEWLKDLQAFKPVANFDVIQYFRIN